jgi:hypothetical protein
MNPSSVLHLSCCHIHLEQTRMQPAQCLTQTDQFVLVAFVLPTQDLPQQGGRARRRPVTPHARLAEPARERRFDHQQPGRKPRVIVELARAGKRGIEAPAQRIYRRPARTATPQTVPAPAMPALQAAATWHPAHPCDSAPRSSTRAVPGCATTRRCPRPPGQLPPSRLPEAIAVWHGCRHRCCEGPVTRSAAQAISSTVQSMTARSVQGTPGGVRVAPRSQDDGGRRPAPRGPRTALPVRYPVPEQVRSLRKARRRPGIRGRVGPMPCMRPPHHAAATAPVRHCAASRHDCRRRYRVVASSSRSEKLPFRMGQISPLHRAAEGAAVFVD